MRRSTDSMAFSVRMPILVYQPWRALRATGCMRWLRRVAIRLSNQRLNDWWISRERRPASGPFTLMSSSSLGQ